MSLSIIGDIFKSISVDGPDLFAEGTISVGFGKVVIDLVSAPLPPGTHQLHLQVGLGDVEVYVPRHVQVTVDGVTLVGDKKFYEGLDWGKQLAVRAAEFFGARSAVPTPVPESRTSTAEVKVRIKADTGLGDVKVFRL